MLEGRFEARSARDIPTQWIEACVNLLNNAYHKQLEENNRFFDVHGKIHDKEIIVAISYVHHDDHGIAPITLTISHDLETDDKKLKDCLDNLVHLASHIFDDIFQTTDWNGYNTNWTENTYKSNTFFYKITRENLSLTIMANELLKDSGKH